jgi:Mg-chelatase subunit ChlD
VAAAGVRAIVVDVETGDVPLRLAEELADSMGARYVRVTEATAEHIDCVVRSVVSPPACCA